MSSAAPWARPHREALPCDVDEQRDEPFPGVSRPARPNRPAVCNPATCPAVRVGTRPAPAQEDDMPSMHKVLIGLMTLVMPASLAAQKLTPGTWTGTISPPGQGALDASFVVRVAGDTTKLTLAAGGME